MKQNQPVVVLLTDFGAATEYVGMMKGVIAGICPSATIIDLSHRIRSQCVLEAAVLLANSWSYFPPGSVLACVVDPGVGAQREIVCMAAGGRFFLAPDNGLLWPLAERIEQVEFRTVTNRSLFLPHVSSTFHGRDIFAPVAARLAAGLPFAELGQPLAGIARLDVPSPAVREDGSIAGQVLYADSFGNLVTNVPEDILEQHLPMAAPGAGGVEILGKCIPGVFQSYAQVEPGELLALVGSSGLLEIAVNQGRAEKTLGALPGTPVVVLRARTDE